MARKWYGTMINHLRAHGAQQIFVDISFLHADALHPESDAFFYSVVSRESDVYFLNADTSADTFSFLGIHRLPKAHSFGLFSDFFEISADRMIYHPSQRSLTSILAGPSGPERSVVIEYPDTAIVPEISWLSVIHNTIDRPLHRVVVALDYPGTTSYLYRPDGVAVSTSYTQIWAAHCLIQGHYRYRLSTGVFVMMLILVIGTVIALISWRTSVSVYVTLVSGGILIALVGLMGYAINGWFYLWIMPGLLIGSYRLWQQIMRTNIKPPVAVAVPDKDVNESDYALLKYKLNFYENAAQTLPDDVLQKSDNESGVLFHETSPLREVLVKAAGVASSDIPVIVQGESGTGKERLAQFIHARSARSEFPFIAVNCGSFNENLIEAELFGYEKGAFTGAHQSKPGRFELANKGTLFLDEIADTSLAFQVKLLRVLQEGVLERVGGIKPIAVSVRLIVATHRDLRKMVREGGFREDLFYRLHGFEITLPSLRERRMDIEVLVASFLKEANARLTFSDELMSWLCQQNWPGNVRQLQSATRRAIVNAGLRGRTFLLPEDFELGTIEKLMPNEDTAERILSAFRKNEFRHRSVSAVASDLSIHRVTVTEYLRGWILRGMSKKNDEEAIMNFLTGGAVVYDVEPLRRRISEYKSYIESRIDEGLRNNDRPENFVALRYKNLPGEFHEDAEAVYRDYLTNSKL